MKKILLLALVVLSITSCKKSDEPSNVTMKFDKMTLVFDDVALITKQLKVVEPSTYASDPRLKWTSTNENVATVDQNGNVKAVGIGQTSVFAFISGLDAVRAECKVTVLGKGYSLKITAERLTINAGDTITGTYTYAPAIPAGSTLEVWQSDTTGRKIIHTRVTESKDGKTGALRFIGLSPGKVKVKLSNSDSKTLLDSLEFTVNEVAITDFQFADVPTEIEVGQKDTLTVAFTPATAAYNTVTWKSSDPYYASVDANGVVTANASTNATTAAQVTIYASTIGNRVIGTVINIKPQTVKNTFTLKVKKASTSISYDPILAGISFTGNVPTVTLDQTLPEAAEDRCDVQFYYSSNYKDFILLFDPSISTIGTARLIVTQGEKDDKGKLIVDTCVISAVDFDDNIVVPSAVYNTIDMGTKTIVSAKFVNLYEEDMTIDKVELILADGKDKKKDKVIETLTPNMNCPAILGSVKVDFATLITNSEHIARYVVKYTFTCPATGLTNVIAMPVKLDNGASFVKKR